MQNIVKIVKQDGTEVPLKTTGPGLYQGKEMPPFYEHLEGYKYVDVDYINPADVTFYGEHYSNATIMQGSHAAANRVNDSLHGRIEYEGFDLFKLPAVAVVDGGTLIPIGGHSRINWAIDEGVVRMPVYLFEDTSSNARSNMITQHLSDNANQDIAEKVTWKSWVDAGKELIDNGELIPGKRNSKETIVEWLHVSGCSKRYDPNKKSSGFEKADSGLRTYLAGKHPAARGLIPTSAEDQQRDVAMLNNKFAESDSAKTQSRKYISANLKTTGGAQAQALAFAIMNAILEVGSENKPYEVHVVLGSPEQRWAGTIYTNRAALAQGTINYLNKVVRFMNLASETTLVERTDEQWQKHIKFFVRCNLQEEQQQDKYANPHGYKWGLRPVTLGELKEESKNSKKAA